MLSLDFLACLLDLIEPLEIMGHYLYLLVWLDSTVRLEFVVIVLILDDFHEVANDSLRDLDGHV